MSSPVGDCSPVGSGSPVGDGSYVGDNSPVGECSPVGDTSAPAPKPVKVTVSKITLNETNKELKFATAKVTFSPALPQDFLFAYVSYSGPGDTATPGVDYASFMNTFPLTKGTKSTQLPVIGLPDRLKESNETFTIEGYLFDTVNPASGISYVGAGRVTIKDND